MQTFVFFWYIHYKHLLELTIYLNKIVIAQFQKNYKYSQEVPRVSTEKVIDKMKNG